MISSPKTMSIIFWSPLGFFVRQALPLKVTFTSEFFVDAILRHIIAGKPASDPGRRLVLYMGNASPHRASLIARNLEANRITASPRPAVWQDLAPFDFFLFGALRGQLSGRIFESREELVEAIRQIASAIPRTTLERLSLEWKEGLQRYINIDGAYVDESLRWHDLSSPFSSGCLDATDSPDTLYIRVTSALLFQIKDIDF
jgi:hypothetical protein